MNRLKYLIIGILALIMAGCGQTVVETLNVPEGAGPNAPGTGKRIVVLPFADYSYADNLASSHRRNLQITESLTDRFAVNGFNQPIQEDVFRYMIDQQLINLVAYEKNSVASLTNEIDNEWSDRMKGIIQGYIEQERVARTNKVLESPGTHGLTEKTVRKIGRRFNADYVVRGRILEYKTRQDPSWEPWKKGILPFAFQGASRIAYGFAGSDQYDEWNTMTAGAALGALIGYNVSWPFDGDGAFDASVDTSNSIFWGAAGAGLGKLAHNSGKIEQAVVQMRIWVQEAATGDVVWTNRMRVTVAPESVFADSQYDALFNAAIDKSVTSLIDNFVTYGL